MKKLIVRLIFFVYIVVRRKGHIQQVWFDSPTWLSFQVAKFVCLLCMQYNFGYKIQAIAIFLSEKMYSDNKIMTKMIYLGTILNENGSVDCRSTSSCDFLAPVILIYWRSFLFWSICQHIYVLEMFFVFFVFLERVVKILSDPPE